MRNLKRLATIMVGAVVGLGLWCGSPNPAVAGRWDVSFEVYGNFSRHGSFEPINEGFGFNLGEAKASKHMDDQGNVVYTVTRRNWNNSTIPQLTFELTADRSWYNTIPVGVPYSAYVTVTPILIWVSNDPNEIAPKTAIAWVQAQAGVWGTGLGEVGASMNVDNGLGTPAPSGTWYYPSPDATIRDGRRTVIGGKIFTASRTGPSNSNPQYRLPSITMHAQFSTVYFRGGFSDLSAAIWVNPDVNVSPAPTPRGAAVASCSTLLGPGLPQPVLNQYVLTGIEPTVIPVGISYQGRTEEGLLHLQENARWEWKRPGCLPILPCSILNNHATSQNVTDPPYPLANMRWDRDRAYTVRPVYIIPPLITGGQAYQGGGFAFLDLPESNEYFGTYDVGHFIGNQQQAVSPVALFYRSTGELHPGSLSGIPGYRESFYAMKYAGAHKNRIPTPNWFYYYVQALGFQDVNMVYIYDPSVSEYGMTKHDIVKHPNNPISPPTLHIEPEIHISQNCHGYREAPFFGLRPDPTTGNMRLRWLGMEDVYGIDILKRTVLHELKHWTILNQSAQYILDGGYNEYGKPYLDLDNDGLSNDYEIATGPSGLRFDDPDTTEFGDLPVPGNPEEYEGRHYVLQEEPPSQSGEPLVGEADGTNTRSGNYSTGIADSEVVAFMEEQGQTGPRDGDWADDGLNRGLTNPLGATKNLYPWTIPMTGSGQPICDSDRNKRHYFVGYGPL